MDNKIIYIKIKNAVIISEIIKRFDNSYEQDIEKYYNFTDSNSNSHLNDLDDKGEYYFFALVYDEKENNKIVKTFLGTGIYSKTEKTASLKFRTKYRNSDCTAMLNLRNLSNLDLNGDFTDGYVFVEDSEFIAKQIGFIINEPYKYKGRELQYEKIAAEGDSSETDQSKTKLNFLAQRNEYCERQYNLHAPSKTRGEFQRDYERIIHSKAFRRMVDKAQIFTAAKGDHYRTRMTHSQAVYQIAKGIAVELKLNLDLTEAIALGHDIGHTPFGHQGERTLDAILEGKSGIIKNADMYDDHFGGFKHSYQSVRVASTLEETYIEMNGMDLSYQTLEGMLKHTGLKSNKYDLSEFIDAEDAKEKLHFDTEICSTLEGQIVNIADEIAQRGHDLDDALSSGVLTLDELAKYLAVNKAEDLRNKLFGDNGIIPMLDAAKAEGRCYSNETELKNSRVVSVIITHFIKDVIETSKCKIEKYCNLYSIRSADDFTAKPYVSEQLVELSDKAKKLCRYLETIIGDRVINSSEVALFDSNGATIVEGLFKAYYNNPCLLHKGTKRKIYIEIRKSGIKNVVDFELGNRDAIRQEIEKISFGNLKEISDNSEEKTNPNELQIESSEREEYKVKRRILVRCICDYISGMTDTYAINEYGRISK